MRKLRVLVMMDESLVPPESVADLTSEQIAPFKTELDVLSTLSGMGHAARAIGIKSDLSVLRGAIEEFKPHICFNLVEDFDGNSLHDQHVVSYLELLKQPYTGTNPRGLTLARDKALSKKILAYHNIATPKFEVFALNRAIKRPEDLPFPLLVKSLIEEGSVGISQASVVRTDEELAQRVAFIHEKLSTDAIAEQYIEGRELYVSILGNRKLQAFPIWELCMDSMPEGTLRIATSRVKWNRSYQEKHSIASRAASDLPATMQQRINDVARETYRWLDLSGYARIDLRLTPDNQLYVLEANPNPQIAKGEDFADSAHAAGISYEALLQKILSLGLHYQPLGLAAA